MDREVASRTEARRPLRPKRAIALVAAVVAAVGGLALNPLPAHADHTRNQNGFVWQPDRYGYATLENYFDGSEAVYVCDQANDGRRVWATFRFPNSTEEALWAPYWGGVREEDARDP